MKILKKIRLTLFIAVLGFTLVTAALAQDKETSPGHYRASKVIGHDVENPQGESLGDIEDLVFDKQDGTITYAVLSFGGFLGIGDKYFAVPLSALQVKAGEDDTFVLDIDKERLRNAPSFDKNNWPDTANSEWGQQIHAYYGQTDAWTQRQARMLETRQEGQQTGQIGQMQAQREGQQTGQNEATVMATVQDVEGRLQLQTQDGQTMEFQVSEQLLQSLQNGDSVEVVLRKKDSQ